LLNACDVDGILRRAYIINENKEYGIKHYLDPTLLPLLKKLLSSQNSLYLFDNGYGMSNHVIKNHWMTIGTDIKNRIIRSRDGRVVTGAKGIGRFALDRLGDQCEMITSDKDTCKTYRWFVRWPDFEKEGATIEQVEAELDEKVNFSYAHYIKSILGDCPNLFNKINDGNFSNGTCFKITCLRDDWTTDSIEQFNKMLKVLNPPGRMDFTIYTASLQNPDQYEKICSAEFEDYDYKIVADVKPDQSVEYTIYRNEFDVKNINKSIFEKPEMQQSPYDYASFKKGEFKSSTSLKSLLPGFKDKFKLMDNIGEFSFTFYFMKRAFTIKDKNKYYYHSFNSQMRQILLDKYGGIKIFRDFFRVKPYGEVGSASFDWLGLGDRKSESPAGPSHTSGSWRVGSNQVAGIINISRINNIKFEDKSSREGLQISEEFNIFRDIIIALLSIFERDRQYIMRVFDRFFKEINKEEEKKNQANLIAKKVVSESSDNDSSQDNEKKTMAESILIYQKEQDEKNEELKLLRMLATNGLVVTTFSHELQNINTVLVPRTERLKSIIEKLIPVSRLKELGNTSNPIVITDDMLKDNKKLTSWLEFALKSVRLDKRTRKSINLLSYFAELNVNWCQVLELKNIKLILPEYSVDKKFWKKGFIMDFDAILYNLISNSIEAFKREDAPDKKVINVELSQKNDCMVIEYNDTGPGLLPEIEDPLRIFEPFFTTKRDEQGRTVGTGLGMWIVKSTVEEYKGNIKLGKIRGQFELFIEIPLLQNEGYDDTKI